MELIRGCYSIFKKLLCIGILISFFKIFVCDLYYVPTSSMSQTIEPRSYVVVSKIHYGAKLPKTTHEIPFFSKIFKLFTPVSLWKNKRVYAFENIKRNDVVLAEHPSCNMKIIKRVVANSGDTIKIINGFLKVNKLSEEVKKTYSLKYKTMLNKKEVNDLKNRYNLSYLGDRTFEVSIIGNHLKYFGNKKIMAMPTIVADSIFPKEMHAKWDANNYGAVIIPQKGMEIELTDYNIKVYKEVIVGLEKVKIVKKGFCYYIDGKKQKSYVFTKNYLFLMGDNRMNSIDSRFFGFVPKQNILGKVLI